MNRINNNQLPVIHTAIPMQQMTNVMESTLKKDNMIVNKEISINNKYSSIKISPTEINSTIIDENNNNVLIYLLTLKELLIKKNIISENDFDETYKVIEDKIDLKLTALEVFDELTK